jgi:hypothetical protein
MQENTFVFYAGYARRHALHAFCALSGVLGSCTTYDAAETEAAGYGYPLDTDYATYASGYDSAYTDAWGCFAPLPAPVPQDAGRADESDPVSAIRAAALGTRDVCPGQVTVEPQRATTPCGGGDQPGESQIGVKLTFTDCQLQGGGHINGSLNVTSTHTANDETCSASTTLHVTYSAQFSNLAYTAPSGQKLVIVSLTDTGSYDHGVSQPPTSVTATLQAHIQRYASNGSVSSDRSLSGQSTFTVSASPLTISADATFNMTSAAGNGGSANLTLSGVKHESSCCHPTAGSVTVTGKESGTYAFGPNCGEATKNNESITLDACD